MVPFSGAEHGFKNVQHHAVEVPVGVTIKDVAKLVGVTPATVSMVINNKPRISEATRQKVQEAIRELDYYPHSGARNLVLKRTNTIGVATSFYAAPFVLEILSGIEQEIRNSDYNIILFGTRGLAKTEDAILHQVSRERKVDGLITITLDLKESHIESFKKNNVAVVALERDYKGVDCVVLNNEKGAYDATRHLVELGHRRIAIVNGPDDQPTSQARERGYVKALNEAGIEFDPSLKRITENFFRKEGLEVVNDILSKPTLPTAIFVSAGDNVAVGVLQGLRRSGRRIPEDMSVVGFDDIYLAEQLEPALTTVRQPMQQIGAQALKQVLSSIKDGESHQPFKMVFEPELVVRHSTGPVPNR
jgi:LacI family transcriptional regulator